MKNLYKKFTKIPKLLWDFYKNKKHQRVVKKRIEELKKRDPFIYD